MLPRRPLLTNLILAAALVASPRVCGADGPTIFLGTDTIVTSDVETDCNFNGTAIPCPDYIWFMAVGKPPPGRSRPSRLIQNQHIQLTANSVNYDLRCRIARRSILPPPRRRRHLPAPIPGTRRSPAASGNQLYAGLAPRYRVPTVCREHPQRGLTVSFFASKPLAGIQWTWSAAVH
jgi:hypothetical protein